MSDRELIEQLQGGDLTALGELYDRHKLLVYKTAYGITGDPGAADNLLQDAFLRLYRFANRIDIQRPLEPWLYRMTANLAYTWVKKRSRWINVLETFTNRIRTGFQQSPDFQIESGEEWRGVELALASLKIPLRTVIVFYYIHNLSVNEISEILEIPSGTVKSRLYYGRIALKKQLGSDGIAHGKVSYEYT